jgi:hypothetical protein
MQPDDALNDAALDRELRGALSVDPSPEFVARVRMRIANEPARMPRRAPWLFAVSAIAIVVVAAIVVQSARRAPASMATPPVLTERALTAPVGTLPRTGSYVMSAYRRTVRDARGSTGSPRAVLTPARPELVDQPPRFALRRSAVASAKAEGRAVCSWFDKHVLSARSSTGSDRASKGSPRARSSGASDAPQAWALST